LIMLKIVPGLTGASGPRSATLSGTVPLSDSVPAIRSRSAVRRFDSYWKPSVAPFEKLTAEPVVSVAMPDPGASVPAALTVTAPPIVPEPPSTPPLTTNGATTLPLLPLISSVPASTSVVPP